MKTLSIQVSTTYPIYIDNDLLASNLFITCCQTLCKRFVIITDSNLIHTHGLHVQQILEAQGFDVELLAFPAGEIHKTRETKQQLEDELLQKKYGRDTGVIALGGGVVTDLVGFLAATYCRGLPIIYVPTSLLAMVDASIGGKTGLNTPHGKNLIGTFTQPHAVFIDTNTLNTLPEKEWCNGIAEMLKHSIIADPALFNLLQKNVQKIKERDSYFLIEMIYASCQIKKQHVEQDEKESGCRLVLNFGHTIGHAIEAIEHYKIGHGEAVAIGMLVESYLSVQLGFLKEAVLSNLMILFHDYGLPLKTAAFQDIELFEKTLLSDKKTRDKAVHFVLLDDIGKPHRHDGHYTMPVEPELLKQALRWSAGIFIN